MRWLIATMMLAGMACSSKGPTGPGGTGDTGGGGTGTDTPAPANSCDGARKRVEQLYRADADVRKEKPDRIAEYVSDNTAMVMNDCAKNPTEVVACIKRVGGVPELETTCLVQLDAEGTEGEALRK